LRFDEVNTAMSLVAPFCGHGVDGENRLVIFQAVSRGVVPYLRLSPLWHEEKFRPFNQL